MPSTLHAPAATTTRQPITFSSDGLKVFGVIHRPSAPAVSRRPGVAIYHGFVGSKDQPHRLFVTLAEALARAGFVALRIDLPGRGDSEGETVDITVRADVNAARTALDALEAMPDVDPRRLTVLGMSWGGALAASLAGRDRRVSAAVLWSYAPDELDWRPRFRTIEGREVEELWGNVVGRQFYEGLREIKPLEDIAAARGPVLLAYGTADEDVASAVPRATQALAAAAIAHDVLAIEGADHAFMTQAWERDLIERTVSWLTRRAQDVPIA